MLEIYFIYLYTIINYKYFIKYLKIRSRIFYKYYIIKKYYII